MTIKKKEEELSFNFHRNKLLDWIMFLEAQTNLDSDVYPGDKTDKKSLSIFFLKGIIPFSSLV